jgi:hypothetical protein
MSDRASSSRRAARNPYSQDAHDKSLDAFLATREAIRASRTLKRPIQGDPSHSNKRQKTGRHEHIDITEVCSHHLARISYFLMTSDRRSTTINLIYLNYLRLKWMIFLVTKARLHRLHAI